jgi:hypothetical protein
VAAQAATGRSGVAAIGVAQEYQNVFAATAGRGRNAACPAATRLRRYFVIGYAAP